jgi:hypothetical protein
LAGLQPCELQSQSWVKNRKIELAEAREIGDYLSQRGAASR